MNRRTKMIIAAVFCALLICLLAVSAFATGDAVTGDVAGAIENTWDAAKGQIKQIVNRVVFPIIDLILAVLFFVKVGLAYMDYRKHGQFEFTAPAILLVTLIFTLTAPLYIWSIIGL